MTQSHFEVWRVVPSQPGLLASSLGRIMITPYNNAKRRGAKHLGGHPTYGQWDGARFIYARRGHKTLKVARLVCEAFNGRAPSGKPVCMHMDEDSKNNKPENLRWGTQKENLNMPRFIAYCKGRTGENSPTYKGKVAA